MIGLIISGCCSGCEDIDLDLITHDYFLGAIPVKQYELRCSHSRVCGKLEAERIAHPLLPDEEVVE